MLILTLEPGCTITISIPGKEDIVLHNPESVSQRIGFVAPREYQIVRSNAKNKTPRLGKQKWT